MSPASESILSQALRFENLREADCQFGFVCDEPILDIYHRATVIPVGFPPCGVENPDVLAAHRNIVFDLALHAAHAIFGRKDFDDQERRRDEHLFLWFLSVYTYVRYTESRS